MTGLRTRPVEEQRREEAATGIRTATRGRIIVLALVNGVLAGCSFTSAGPSRAKLEKARWQHVVDYYERHYQTMADAQARKEAAYWEDVISHYVRQYELVANASSNRRPIGSQPIGKAPVDCYERRLLRTAVGVAEALASGAKAR